MIRSHCHHTHQLETVQTDTVSTITIKSQWENSLHSFWSRITPEDAQIMSQVGVVVPVLNEVLGNFNEWVCQQAYLSNELVKNSDHYMFFLKKSPGITLLTPDR